MLICALCCGMAEDEEGNANPGVIIGCISYWFNDFWGGLFANMILEMFVTKDQIINKWSPQVIILQLFLACLAQAVGWDLPLQCVRSGCSPKVWVATVCSLGAFLGSIAVAMAYAPLYIAVLGNRPLMLAFFSWMISFPKAAGIAAAKRMADLGDARVKKFKLNVCAQVLFSPLPDPMLLDATKTCGELVEEGGMPASSSKYLESDNPTSAQTDGGVEP